MTQTLSKRDRERVEHVAAEPAPVCATCRFWTRWPHTKTIGTCKRFPSQYVGDEDGLLRNEIRAVSKSWAAWSQPVMSENGFCGEHRS